MIASFKQRRSADVVQVPLELIEFITNYESGIMAICLRDGRYFETEPQGTIEIKESIYEFWKPNSEKLKI